ncbi:hypothetical protein [Mesorhizobium sp. NPDC059025]|uniref:hypothetical protein n=1 Tax=unclassified Mesorhizobium TaxID=325217 RepID=UPI0036A0B524
MTRSSDLLLPLSLTLNVEQLQQCAWRATAIINLCRRVADNLPVDTNSVDAGSDINQALAMAYELVGFIGDHLDNEVSKGGSNEHH